VNTRIVSAAAVGNIVDSHAIHLKIVPHGVVAVDGHIQRALSKSRGIVDGSAGARGQTDNLSEVPAGERQFGHLAGSYGSSQTRRGGLQRFSGSFYGDLLALRSPS